MTARDDGKCCCRKFRESKPLLLTVVTIGAFLDSMLISTVVPIFPNQLQENKISNTTRDPSNRNENWINLQNETSLVNISQWRNNNSRINDDSNPSQVSTPAPAPAPAPTPTPFPTRMAAESQNGFDISQQSLELGILLASKPLAQLLVNPLVGRYANQLVFLSRFLVTITRYSYRKMMSLGFAVMFSSTLSITALADRFTDEKKRANAIRVALAGLGIGLSVGPPFGGFTYQHIGKTSPFLILCFPYCKTVKHIYVPSAVMGLGAGIVDIALMPEVAHLVDIRHSSVYGNAFAIVDIAMCLGLTIITKRITGDQNWDRRKTSDSS
ncbi:hypothetical protein V9T40_010475 [Parthenolecanium corni]|uniref:Major facilitator superfamily (MFS) profile domain-containing protein n=1 Tax=Parthenolecanium corni TaxID=536013 RepID=A0AAN9T8U0_9HEMI